MNPSGIRVLLNLAVTLDGFIAGPHGEYDWCFTDQDYGMKAFLAGIDATVMGKNSFEILRSHGSETFEGKTNFVFSKSLPDSLKKEVQIIRDDPPQFLVNLDHPTIKTFWLFGGGALISSFLAADLVDELHLAIHPLLLGNGIPLFPPLSERKHFRLISSTPFTTGLVINRYVIIRR